MKKDNWRFEALARAKIIRQEREDYEYYKVHADNKQGWKSIRVKKGTPLCQLCGKTKCNHLTNSNFYPIIKIDCIKTEGGEKNE